jgi:small-conductance mechanosensitive channel
MFEFLRQLQNGVFQEMVTRFSAAIPRIIVALLILLVGWFIARLVRDVLSRVLTGLKADQVTDQLNDMDLVQRTGLRIRLSDLVARMVYYVLLLAFIIFATDMLGIPALTEMVRDLINYLPALFSAFVLLLLGLFLADIVRRIVLTACRSMGIASARLIATAVFYFLFITVAISALSQAGIDTFFIASNLTVLIAGGALAFAFGYGFASRDLVSNYLAGYYNRNKVRVGDEVRIVGMRGKVVLIDAMSMILQTDDRAIVIPLAKLTTEKVEIFYPSPQDDPRLVPGAARPE